MSEATRPVVSVCIANYNGELLLDACIGSVPVQEQATPSGVAGRGCIVRPVTPETLGRQSAPWSFGTTETKESRMTIRQHIPTRLKRLARIFAYTVMDAWDSLRGNREPMTPPRMTALIVGSGDFKRAGEEFLMHFIRECGLKPEHRVLEIGSGYGRMAVGLTPYLSRDGGGYDGIEIMGKAVAWCREEITARFPNFRFHHADLRNPYSNPEGVDDALHYRLPFAQETFDFVLLTSVFSHMRPQEIEAYLGEISRVMKAGASSFITYYLLDDFALDQIRQRRASQPFHHAFDGFLSTSRSTPENTIAVPECTIRQFYDLHGMDIEEPVRFGAWSGRERYLSYQDIVIAHKRIRGRQG